MAVDLRIDRATPLPDGRLEVGYSILLDAVVAVEDSITFPHPQQLTLLQMRQAIKDRVTALKEQYKSGAQFKSLVGTTINIEP